MEQLNMTEPKWKEVMNTMLEDIIKDREFPEKSLVLEENISRKSGKISSYSIMIAKPDYPKGINVGLNMKNSVLNIKPDTKTTKITFNIKDDIANKVSSIFPMVSVDKKKSDVSTTRFILEDNDPMFERFSRSVVDLLIDDYCSNGGGAFGCCHLYEQCSDAKKCLHENKLYALGCAYYHNLKAGRIFYGKNRNV